MPKIIPQENESVTSDVRLRWLTREYGAEWEQWRRYAEGWVAENEAGINNKVQALRSFFVRYLTHNPRFATDPRGFFVNRGSNRSRSDEFIDAIRNGGPRKAWMIRHSNDITSFIDWIIRRHFSELNENGVYVALLPNPMRKIKTYPKRSESAYTPLPYRFIQRLREILCPDPIHGDFQDWKWAQKQLGTTSGRIKGDWIEVPEEIIDKDDPDCVWRERRVKRNNKNTSITEIWSPVRAMAIFIKLHLPLRTYQVRMLDSGEADTWRYEGGEWIENDKHSFRYGDGTRPYARGVFRRIFDSEQGRFSTGLYINTNKNADQNRKVTDKGYVIPWENNTVLRWLEKLRNWQEKYNPIDKPTEFKSLQKKHLGALKSQAALEEMGECCFLFRCSTGRKDDKKKPISVSNLDRLWYKLLSQLEEEVASGSEGSEGIQRLKFVASYRRKQKVRATRCSLVKFCKFPPFFSLN